MSASHQVWTVKSILDWCIGYLDKKGDPNPRLSAQLLVSETTGLSRVELFTNFDRPLNQNERAVLHDWVARRAAGEPLQLIYGKAPFRYQQLKVAPGVLIPRPETEVLVSEALRCISPRQKVDQVVMLEEGESITPASLRPIRAIDLCTGSGCIACALASEYPAIEVLALDIADEAIKLAQENVSSLDLEDKVSVEKSDLLANVRIDERNYGSFDLLVSNPPYIPSAYLEMLDREVRDFEPLIALNGGVDGLDVVRSFIDDAFWCLRKGGFIALELFEAHMDQACDIVEKAGFEKVRIVQDLAQKDRVLVAQKPSS